MKIPCKGEINPLPTGFSKTVFSDMVIPLSVPENIYTLWR